MKLKNYQLLVILGILFMVDSILNQCCQLNAFGRLSLYSELTGSWIIIIKFILGLALFILGLYFKNKK